MFTGIIEARGLIEKITNEGTNRHFYLSSKLGEQLKIDQSVSHNGVCLTVVDVQQDYYIVTAIEETLNRSNLGLLKVGDYVNLERSMVSGGRLDGHIVQGHVDTTGKCTATDFADGSWYFTFEFPNVHRHLLVDKGSVCINGVSLTVINPTDTHFTVAIIPYTFNHTNFKTLAPNEFVNLEFDILGKYIARYLDNIHNKTT